MSEGKVWLVGAGPGDVGLFTLKGYQTLLNAEVVVYDSLVGHGIMSLIPEGVKCINVGKRSSHHTMPQWKINEVLLEEAQKGRRVVRLKGGDPFMFGRGGEELELLEENGIPYEIVPGITSPLSVPAYNGIPVTHRDFCSSLHIITGHKKEGKDYDINFKALVETNGTLVFLMGVTAMEDICFELMKAGMDPDMPAAILQQGTTARQRRAVATVSTLKEEAEKANIQAPAVIVVGKVCELERKFAWYEKLPLAGYRVLVTRPKDLVSTISEKLRIKGAEVLELPAIKTVPLEDQSRLYTAFDEIEKYQWVVFTSPTGVKVFFDEMKKKHMDIRLLGKAKIASIGIGTKKELEKRGIFTDLMPEIYDGEHLGKALAGVCNMCEHVLIPRAKTGNHEIIDALCTKNLVVDDVPTYNTIYEKQDVIDECKEFTDGNIDCAVFTSASTVKGFAEATKGLDYSLVNAACIGKQTKAAADAFGMKTSMAEKTTLDSLVELVIQLKENKT